MSKTRTKDPQPIRQPATGDEMPLVESIYCNVCPADVERVEYNYINSLPDPDSIYNINAFIGLLFVLHREVIKPAISNPTEPKPGVKGYNIQVLDSIFFNIFIPLIAKYRIIPTMGLFYYLTGLDSSVTCRWNKGNSNNIYNSVNDIDNSVSNVSNDENNNINRYSYYQKWSNYIEQWILSDATNRANIGSIFCLKAVYGYNDAQTIRIEQAGEVLPTISAKQLERIGAGDAATLPELPETPSE